MLRIQGAWLIGGGRRADDFGHLLQVTNGTENRVRRWDTLTAQFQ
jgi:hypothetical protein